MNNAFNVRANHGFDPAKIKNIWVYAFEETRKDEKKRNEMDKALLADVNNKEVAIPIDLLFDFELKSMD